MSSRTPISSCGHFFLVFPCACIIAPNTYSPIKIALNVKFLIGPILPFEFLHGEPNPDLGAHPAEERTGSWDVGASVFSWHLLQRALGGSLKDSYPDPLSETLTSSSSLMWGERSPSQQALPAAAAWVATGLLPADFVQHTELPSEAERHDRQR